jgi:hypothetical protein
VVAGAEAGLIGFDVKPIFLLLASIAIVASVRANIGENEEKINSSYGNRIERRIRDKNGKDTAQLEKGGTISDLYDQGNYLFLVVFEEDLSVFEMYGRKDNQPLKPQESFRFLRANDGGVGWTVLNEKEQIFERADHRLRAEFREMAGRPTLIVRVVKKKN